MFYRFIKLIDDTNLEDLLGAKEVSGRGTRISDGFKSPYLIRRKKVAADETLRFIEGTH